MLQQLLERAELAKLPRAVQGKLERFLGDQQGEIDGLRARHERFKVDSGECERRARGAAAVPVLRGGSAGRARSAMLSSRGSRGVPWGCEMGWEGGGKGPAVGPDRCLSLALAPGVFFFLLFFCLAKGTFRVKTAFEQGL